MCPAWLAPWCFSPRQPLCCPQAPTFKSMSSTTDAYTFLCSATGCSVIPIWKSKRRPFVSICTLKTGIFLIPKEMSGWKRHSTNVLDKTHGEATQNVTTRRICYPIVPCFWGIVENAIRILLSCPNLLHERTQNLLLILTVGATHWKACIRLWGLICKRKKIYLETAPFFISSVGEKNKSLTWVPGSRADAVKLRSTRGRWTVLSCTPRESVPHPLPGTALGSYLECQGKHVLTCLWRERCFYWGKWEKRRWKIRNCLHLAAFAPMSYLMSKLYTCDSLSCPKALTWESGCQTVRPALPSISISPESLVSVSKAPEPQVRGLTAQALAPYLLCDVTNKFRARCWWQVEFHLFLFLFLFFLDVYL